MGAIRILDENVANQIAAGEVVERPASVVKELLENSLDAGASRIDLGIEDGGLGVIRVSDDGTGMDRDDAVLALERHATSKIRGAEDLRAIATFGFRGEALPSIASVARMILTTATGAPVGGTRVVVRAGAIERIEPAPHPRGTTIQVDGLFHNAPARRKFLRSPSTEASRIADLLAIIAACHPGVAFSLQGGGRQMVSWGAVPSLRERVAQITGPRDAGSLLGIERQAGGLRVRGLASAPELQRSTSRGAHLYVNSRPVRDRRLLHAVLEAYATLLPRGRYPVVYLFLELPPVEVDVNVHPSKAEVRFLRPGAIHELVRGALLAALRSSRPFYSLAGDRGRPVPALSEPPPEGTGLSGDPGPQASDDTWPGPTPSSGDRPLFDAVPIAPLAQFRDSYILAAAPDGLMIFDQHAAHERILYERFLDQSRGGRVERQRLLFPLTLEVTPAQQQAFEAAADALQALGFSISTFGENVLRIAEVPAIVPSSGLDRLLRDLLDEILEWRSVEGIESLRHRIVSTTACHAAVTANQPLGQAEMGRIVEDLMRSESPMTCPHGRPVLLRLGVERLEREFRRR